MDIEFQKAFFIKDFDEELSSPIFTSDDNLNNTLRRIFQTPIYLILIALISLFNITMHIFVMIKFYVYHETDYFWLSFHILLLNIFVYTMIMIKYLSNNSSINSNIITNLLCCCLCLPFGIIFPYLLMIIPQRYFIQYEDDETSQYRLLTINNRKFVSLIIQGYTLGIPQSILMAAYLYNIGNEFNMFYVKIALFSSILVMIQSLFMLKLTKFLDKMYNAINMFCAIIDILMIYIMILYYHRAYEGEYKYDIIIFNIWFINSIIGISFIFIFIFSYFILIQHSMMPQINGGPEICMFCCCILCFMLIPYPVIVCCILIAMEFMTYSWIMVFIRMFCVGKNWYFVQFIVGSHISCFKKKNLKKEKKIYRLYNINHMLTTDGKNDIDTEKFEEYLSEKYEENKFNGINTLKELKTYSLKEKLTIIDKVYSDYVYQVLEVNQNNGSIYKYHKPFTFFVFAIYFISRIFKLFFPFFVFIGIVMNYNYNEFNKQYIRGTNFLLFIVSMEILFILILMILLIICIKQIYYGWYVIWSTPHNKIYARNYIQFLAAHRVLSNIIGNDDIARVITTFCGHLQKLKPDCPGKHGLTESKSDGFFHCDICRDAINAGDAMYSCRKCDFDACEGCYKYKSNEDEEEKEDGNDDNQKETSELVLNTLNLYRSS